MRQARRRIRGLVIGGLVGVLTVLGSGSVGAQQAGSISNTSGGGRTGSNESSARGTFTPGTGTGGPINTSSVLTGADTFANNDSGSRGIFSPGVGTGGPTNTSIQDTGADRVANNDSGSRGIFNPGIGTGGR